MSYLFPSLVSTRVLRLLLWTVGVWGLLGPGPQEASGQTPITGDPVPCEDGQAGRYPCEDADLLSYLPIPSIGGGSDTAVNDLWGWTDPETGVEYTLVGRTDGLAFVDVSTPTDPVYVGELPTHSRPSLWRDVKVYENHAFVVSEAPEHGMQIFDLTQLRDVNAGERPVTFSESAHYDGVESAHNVVLNTDTGFAYIVGSHGDERACGGGLHMVNVQNPTSPAFVGCFADPSTGRAGTGYTHDAQCVTYQGPDDEYRDGEICFNANETAVNIADVTDKDNPATIANATYPQVGYVHQAWLTEDHRYLYVDDELDEQADNGIDRTRTLVFDVTDLDNPELAKAYLGTTGAIDHNQYIDGNYAYQANYQSGLRLLEVAVPSKPVEVAFFDTYPEGNNASFDGAWSTYPFFERNFVVVSSIGEGLFVVRPRVSPILSVNAIRRDGGALLRWRISATAQTRRIDVEHKVPEARDWELDATVGGSSTSVPEYQHSFDNLRPGAHQFRVRHVSTDGTVHTSDPVTVRVLPGEPYLATGPFPNPVQNRALFKIVLREAQDLRVALYDALGRRVAVLHDGSVPNGVIQRIRIRARRRASGTYFLRVRGESIQLLRKVVVAR